MRIRGWSYYYQVCCLLAGPQTYGRYDFPPLCLIDTLSFPSISIFSFLLQLPISSSVSQIIKELCSSSPYSFHFSHLSFNGIMQEAISSQNMTNPIGVSTQDIIQKCPLLSYTFNKLSFSDHFIFSILLQYHISKLSKYFPRGWRGLAN